MLGNLILVPMNLLSVLSVSSSLFFGTMAFAAEQVIFQQRNEASIDNQFRVNAITPNNMLGITQWFTNPYSSSGGDVPIDWDVGDFTAFYPSNNHATQRGVSNSWYGSTAVQSEGGTVGFQMHTWSAFAPGTNLSSLVPIVAGYNFGASEAPRPFVAANKVVALSLDLQIPGVFSDGGAIPYASLYYYFADQTHLSRGGFWLGTALYDYRQSAGEMVMFDSGTQSPIVGSVAGLAGARYSEPLGGAAFQPLPWKGYQRFRFGVSAANLRAAITDVKQKYPSYAYLSDNPADYAINGVNFNPEIARQGGDAWMGLSFRNMAMSILDSPEPAGFYRVGSGGGIFRSNGYDGYCVYASWSNYLADGGLADTSNVKTVSAIPARMTSYGDCATKKIDQNLNHAIVGWIDGATRNPDGSVVVRGWSCAVASTATMGIHVYAVNPGGAQSYLSGGNAALPAEPAVGQACQDMYNSPHRFAITVSAATASAHRGEKLFVYGLYGDAKTSQNAALGNSSVVVMP